MCVGRVDLILRFHHIHSFRVEDFFFVEVDDEDFFFFYKSKFPSNEVEL